MVIVILVIKNQVRQVTVKTCHIIPSGIVNRSAGQRIERLVIPVARIIATTICVDLRIGQVTALNKEGVSLCSSRLCVATCHVNKAFSTTISRTLLIVAWIVVEEVFAGAVGATGAEAAG